MLDRRQCLRERTLAGTIADRRRKIALEILHAKFPVTRPATAEIQRYLTLAKSLLALCT